MTELGTSPADFPQCWQKPPTQELLACLRRLRIEPPLWGPAASRKAITQEQENSAQYRREAITYLTSIVKCDLDWIDDDDEKDAIWDEASRRISERCGRAGMGEIVRRWPFENRSTPFGLTIREPPITGDSLGLKTWGSSYLLAQQLDKIAAEGLAHLLRRGDCQPPLRVLELGSGTGLLGMAAAAMWQVHVVLTDLPEIVPNLKHNVEANRRTIEELGGNVSSAALTWGSDVDSEAAFTEQHLFKVVLVADGLYDDDHPELLASALLDQLVDDRDSRAVIMIPQRDLATRKLTAKFRAHLLHGPSPLAVLQQNTLTVQDDWDEDDDKPSVESWLAIFGRC